MTTIAATRDAMSCDHQYTKGNLKFSGIEKIQLCAPHPRVCQVPFIIGMAGMADQLFQLMAYYSEPDAFKKVPNHKDMCGIILTAKKELYMFGSSPVWLPVKEKFLATGSGEAYAFGAMAQGANSEEAVKIAARFDPNTNSKVTTLKF